MKIHPMKYLIVITISIFTIASITSFFFSKRKKIGNVDIDKNNNIEGKNINNLFDEDNNEFKQNIKKGPKIIKVALKDISWWQLYHKNFWCWCLITFFLILVTALSPISHYSYNAQQARSFQIEQQKILRDNTIKALKDSIRNEQIKIISSKLDNIDVHVKKIHNTTSKVVIFNKTIIKK